MLSCIQITHIGVTERDTHPEKKTLGLGKMGLQNTNEGGWRPGGVQFLPQNCRAKAYVKGVFFHRRRNRHSPPPLIKPPHGRVLCQSHEVLRAQGLDSVRILPSRGEMAKSNGNFPGNLAQKVLA